MRLVRIYFFYLLLILILYLILETFSYFSLKKLTTHGIYPAFDLIKQDLKDYNVIKNNQLGWNSKSPHKNEYKARKIKNHELFKNNCIEVYGNSYTEGVDVEYQNSWPSLLSQKINCRVINFGVEGYGTDQSYLKYKSKNKISEIVVINHFSENIVRNINQFRNLIYPSEQIKLKPRFILENNKIKLIPLPKIASLEKEELIKSLKYEYFNSSNEKGIIEDINYPYSIKLAKVLIYHHKFKALFKKEPHSKQFYNLNHKSNALQITIQIMIEFNNVAKNKNQIPVITIIPHCKDIDYFKKNKKIPYQNLIDKINSNKLLYLDFLPKILENTQNHKKLYIDNCKGQHFNEKGNAVIADIFFSFLDKNGLLF